MRSHQINRLRDLLDYIDDHLSDTLSLDHLGNVSCWSRWQLQRVFQLVYGQSLASYVRIQRLSRSAEALLNSQRRVGHIAGDCGFESPAVFSRAFRDHFGCTPREYRRRRRLVDVHPKYLPPPSGNCMPGFNLSIRAKPSFVLQGLHTTFNSIYSSNANNQDVLYGLWKRSRLTVHRAGLKPATFYALVDTSTAINEEGDGITYWAGLAAEGCSGIHGFESLLVPAQNYAVFKHIGPLRVLKDTLLFFLLEWLPASDYRCAEGLELELHPASSTDINAGDFEIEFWMPVCLKE